MMKIVACFALAVAALMGAQAQEDYREDTYILPRLGHFKEQPFLELYAIYASAFIKPRYEGRHDDDFRNYAPSGDDCATYLKSYTLADRKVESLEDVIILDACLGYLFENNSEESQTLHISEQSREYLESMKLDEGLRKLWEGTKIDSMDRPAQECVANLLANSVLARDQYKDVRCNNHYIQLYLQFGQCQEQAKIDHQSDDTYLRIVYDLLKDRVRFCVDQEVVHISNALRANYNSRVANKVRNKASSYLKTSSAGRAAAKQAAERNWAPEIIQLFQVIENTEGAVNPREINRFIRGVVQQDNTLNQRYLGNLAEYANKKILGSSSKSAEAKDPAGQQRYTEMVNKLCSFFRASDFEKKYDYATAMTRLVELLRYEDIFGVRRQEFVNKILTCGIDSKPVYLGVAACNILTFTHGSVSLGGNGNPKKYNVGFVPDTSRMVLWPDAGYY